MCDNCQLNAHISTSLTSISIDLLFLRALSHSIAISMICDTVVARNKSTAFSVFAINLCVSACVREYEFPFYDATILLAHPNGSFTLLHAMLSSVCLPLSPVCHSTRHPVQTNIFVRICQLGTFICNRIVYLQFGR